MCTFTHPFASCYNVIFTCVHALPSRLCVFVLMCVEMEEIGAHEREAKKKALFEELKVHIEQARAVRKYGEITACM